MNPTQLRTQQMDQRSNGPGLKFDTMFTLAVLLFEDANGCATQTIVRQYSKRSFQSHELFEVGNDIAKAVQRGCDEIVKLYTKSKPIVMMDHKQFSCAVDPRVRVEGYAPIEYPEELTESFREAFDATDPNVRSVGRCVLWDTLTSIEKHRSKKRKWQPD